MQPFIEDLDLILKERRRPLYGHVERSKGAVKTAFDIQVDGKQEPGKPQDDMEAADKEGLQRVEAGPLLYPYQIWKQSTEE